MIFATCADHTDCSVETALAKSFLANVLGFVLESEVSISIRILLKESNWEIKVPERKYPLGKLRDI